MSEEDEEEFGGKYEEGHWVWDETSEAIVWISDRPSITLDFFKPKLQPSTSGIVDFRTDIDLLEQARFRKRYQRKLKPGEADIITLQDVKDIAIFTAPLLILTPRLISMLHLPTTERFLRALIFYSHYYLQISDTMAERMLELDAKIRTPEGDKIEAIYRENLNDLRALVAKEYCIMLLGAGDMKKFHHMGPQKKTRSLTGKDSHLFETLLRMSVQIVWLSLGRKRLSMLEVEINRIFKTEIFNNVEHRLRTNVIHNMSQYERDTLLGHCVRRQDSKLKTNSPLVNDAFCPRYPIDYRIMGLGVMNYKLSTRLQYMYLAIAGPEEELLAKGVSVGILGLPRTGFDTMLNAISVQTGASQKSIKSMTTVASKAKHSSGTEKKIGSGLSKKSDSSLQKIYPDIVLPLPQKEKPGIKESYSDIPAEGPPVRKCNEQQLHRWQCRLKRLIRPHLLKHKASVASQSAARFNSVV